MKIKGTLGLFIGISLLSIIEIIEVLMEFFMIWYTSGKNKIKIDNVYNFNTKTQKDEKIKNLN